MSSSVNRRAHRDLLPLPLLSSEEAVDRVRGCRHAAQRSAKALAVQRRVNACARGLNFLDGSRPFADGVVPSQAQKSVLDRLQCLAVADEPEVGLGAPEALLQELLGSGAAGLYGDPQQSAGKVTGFSRDLVSLPD